MAYSANRSKVTVVVAAKGWEHSCWLGSFYPEDLPEDWRLAYYANAYPAVLVPVPDPLYPQASAAVWANEVRASFRFFLEVVPRSPSADDHLYAAAAMAESLGSQLGGIVVDLAAVADNGRTLPIDGLVRLGRRFPLGLVGGGASLRDSLARRLPNAPSPVKVWMPLREGWVADARADLTIGILDCGRLGGLRQLRESIERFAASAEGAAEAYLFLHAASFEPHWLDDARTIVQMLGLD